MKKRIITAAIILGAMIAYAQERSMLFDFEGDLSQRWGGPHTELKADTDPASVKEGKQSGRWEQLPKNTWLTMKDTPKDWSAYDTLSFWAYSVKATGEAININVYSDPSGGQGGNYFQYSFTVNWTGWKEIIVPFDRFKRIRAPIGWNTVTSFMLHPQLAGKASADTILSLDDMMLTSKAGAKERASDAKGPLSGIIPRPAIAAYIVVSSPITAAVTVRHTDPGKDERVMLRVFDPDEKLVFWKYSETKKAPAQNGVIIAEKISLSVPGVYQVRISAGSFAAAADIGVPEGTPSGVSFQNGDFTAWDGMPAATFAFMPPHAESLSVNGGPLEILDGNGRTIFSGTQKGTIPVAQEKTVWQFKLGTGAKFKAWGFPLILCNTEEAAKAIHASVEELPDGTVVCWKFQGRIHELLKELVAEKYTGRNDALIADFGAVKTALMKDPVRNSLLANPFDGILCSINALVRSQNLDPKSHWCGALDAWNDLESKPSPQNRWDRLRPTP